MLMRLSRPSRSVTLSRVSQCSIPAGSPSAGASTGRGLDGRCHTVATDTRTQAGVVVCANATACTTGPCVTDTASANTRRSCRIERMSNNGRPAARIVRASFLATPSFAAHVRRGVELLLACPGTALSGWPVEADRRVKSAFTLTPQGVGFSAAALWAADKRPWRWYWRPTRLPIHRTPRARCACRVCLYRAATTANRTAQATAHPMLYAV